MIISYSPVHTYNTDRPGSTSMSAAQHTQEKPLAGLEIAHFDQSKRIEKSLPASKSKLKQHEKDVLEERKHERTLKK